MLIKISLVSLFVMSMATLTIAASALPTPPEVRATVVADLG